MQIEIPIINKSNNPLPHYATSGSSGLDLRAFLEQPVCIKPLERKLIPTGIQIAIPEGYEGQVRPRSGLALKHGITCLNSPGTIDADYRGEVNVLLVNLSNEDFWVSNGERVAQIVFQQISKAEWVEVLTLQPSQRGDGGFGSTGKE